MRQLDAQGKTAKNTTKTANSRAKGDPACEILARGIGNFIDGEPMPLDWLDWSVFISDLG
jgi:hypothetical protein